MEEKDMYDDNDYRPFGAGYASSSEATTDSNIGNGEKTQPRESAEENRNYYSHIPEDKPKKAKKKGWHYTKTELDDQALKMHRFLWGGEACFIADRIELDELSRWQYTLVDDQTVLIYTKKINVLIAKAVITVYFYIDPATCALKKMTQCFDGELHIPFGYKFSSEELEILNALQLPDENLKKYRLRHLYGTVKRNVLFNNVSTKNRKVKEKNLQVDMRIIGSKKETFNYNAKAKVMIIK